MEHDLQTMNSRTRSGVPSQPTNANALTTASEPAGRAVVERMVTKASYAYPASRLSEAEARIRLQVYGEALEDIPADLLGAAFMEAVKTIKFFPSIAELRELSRLEAVKRRWAGVTLERSEPPPAEPQISEEEREEVKRLMAGLSRRLTASIDR